MSDDLLRNARQLLAALDAGESYLRTAACENLSFSRVLAVERRAEARCTDVLASLGLSDEPPLEETFETALFAMPRASQAPQSQPSVNAPTRSESIEEILKAADTTSDHARRLKQPEPARPSASSKRSNPPEPRAPEPKPKPPEAPQADADTTEIAKAASAKETPAPAAAITAAQMTTAMAAALESYVTFDEAPNDDEPTLNDAQVNANDDPFANLVQFDVASPTPETVQRVATPAGASARTQEGRQSSGAETFDLIPDMVSDPDPFAEEDATIVKSSDNISELLEAKLAAERSRTSQKPKQGSDRDVLDPKAQPSRSVRSTPPATPSKAPTPVPSSRAASPPSREPARTEPARTEPARPNRPQTSEPAAPRAAAPAASRPDRSAPERTTIERSTLERPQERPVAQSSPPRSAPPTADSRDNTQPKSASVRTAAAKASPPREAPAKPAAARATAGLYGGASVPTIRDSDEPRPRAASIQINPSGIGGRVIGIEEEDEPIEVGEAEGADDSSSGFSLQLKQDLQEEDSDIELAEEDLEVIQPNITAPAPPSAEEIAQMIDQAQDAATQGGNLQLSADLYSDVLDADPNNVAIHVARGRVFLDLGDYSRAMSDFMVAEDIAPDDPEPQVAIGDLYFTRKDYRKAIDYFNAALQLDPNHPMAFCRRGMSHYYRKNFKEAVDDLLRAERLDPDIPNIQTYVSMARKKVKGK